MEKTRQGGGRITKEHKESKKDLHRAFFTRPLWQRTAVVIAGVVMNTLLAVVIYYAFLGISNFRTELPLIGQHTFVGVNQQIKSEVIISDVVKGSPADNAGVKSFSRIISLNGQTLKNAQEFADIIKDSKGKEVSLVWEDLKTKKRSSGVVVPRVNPPKNQGSLGVAFYPANTVTLSYDTPTQKIFSGFVHPYNLMAYNFDVLGQLIDVSVKEKTAKPISEGVSGPVGIYSLVGQILDIPDAKERLLTILNLSGLLSISLAFFNVLPIPGLDGGRLFFIILEAITRRKINPKIEGYIHAVGMVLLIGLLLLVTIKDVSQFFK